MTACWTDHCIDEIVELHQFFEQWFGGQLPDDDQVFARFSDALHESFHMITPTAQLLVKDEILKVVRSAHGEHAADSPDDPVLKIWIDRPRVLSRDGEMAIVLYEEWQQRGADEAEGRLSTAVFQPSPGTPQSITWRHVHETWI